MHYSNIHVADLWFSIQADPYPPTTIPINRASIIKEQWQKFHHIKTQPALMDGPDCDPPKVGSRKPEASMPVHVCVVSKAKGPTQQAPASFSGLCQILSALPNLPMWGKRNWKIVPVLNACCKSLRRFELDLVIFQYDIKNNLKNNINL